MWRILRQVWKADLLSRERFDEALTRVLAMKAMLKLHRKQKEGTLMPPKGGIKCHRLPGAQEESQ